MKLMSSTIIIINGVSSAGKSSLARAFQAQGPEQWVRLSIDDAFRAFPAGANLNNVPYERLRRVFYQQIALWASEGFNLIVDTVFEEPDCVRKAVQQLHPYGAYLVALHCPLDELERREIQRGNRPLGLARSQYEYAHTYCAYDLELDSHSASVEDNAQAITALLDQKALAFSQLQAAFPLSVRRAG
jgi:chloramphenicol 3-O phosphotransferase